MQLVHRQVGAVWGNRRPWSLDTGVLMRYSRRGGTARLSRSWLPCRSVSQHSSSSGLGVGVGGTGWVGFPCSLSQPPWELGVMPILAMSEWRPNMSRLSGSLGCRTEEGV